MRSIIYLIFRNFESYLLNFGKRYIFLFYSYDKIFNQKILGMIHKKIDFQKSSKKIINIVLAPSLVWINFGYLGPRQKVLR